MANKYHSDLLLDSPDIFPRLFNRLNYFIIPSASYVVGVTGSGTSGSGATIYALNTGATANSTAYGRWNPSGTPGAAYGMLATRSYLIKVGLIKVADDAEFEGWVHFRATSGAVKDLDEPGFGLKVSRFAVVGESYGASGRATVSIGTLVNSQMLYMWIKFIPLKYISFWFGTDPFTTAPTASVTDPAYIPTSGLSIFNIAGKNGATGGVQNQFLMSPVHIFNLD